MSGPELIRAAGVTKRFGPLVAVDRVDFVLREHEIAGIIGSNGAGKTTFFNLLTGLFLPDEGTIFCDGHDITRASAQQRVELGLVRTFQLTATFDTLSVADNVVLAWYRAHRNPSIRHLIGSTCRAHRNEPRILDALDTFELRDIAGRRVQHLSLGEKRRLEIAMAMVSDPRVLLLDEPLAGLAESEAKSVLEVLRRHAQRQTILIVEHKISHVRDFVQRLVVMHEGKVIAEGSYDDCLRDPAVRRSYWQIETDADQAVST